MKHQRSSLINLPGIVSAGWMFILLGCAMPDNEPITAISYICGDEPEPDPSVPAPRCGEGDPRLPPEPTLPPDPPEDCILKASRIEPPEGQVLPEPQDPTQAMLELDGVRINAALARCPVVKLVTDGDKNAFLSSNIKIDGGLVAPGGKTLWIDEGVTLFQSRNPALFQQTGNCGAIGVNDSSACLEFITVQGMRPSLVGRGTIDGQGGEPMVGKDYSWWQASYALRAVNGSIGQPNMINLKKGTTGFILYGLTLHNAAKFHVKLTSSPPEGALPGVCDSEPYGKGYIVWGITLLTPSKWFNSAGYQLTPSWARNSDGVDPGTTDIAYCGVIACSTISTGDDQIAIKGGHWVENLTIAHMRFGTGHGMSIGSETYGSALTPDNVLHRGVQNVHVYDLTIDADSRPVGHEAHAADFNGIRIKTDESRGGLVDNITYEDVCLRDMVNGILISTAYNPLFAGQSYPDFRRVSFKNIRGVTCKALNPSVITLDGFNATLRPEISMDNVVFDNINPDLSVSAEFAKFHLGPGDVNFTPTGRGVDIMSDSRTGTSTPKECKFPKLPAPKEPEGWLH
jgi:polygalacturonase